MTRPPYTLADFTRDATQARETYIAALGRMRALRADKRLRADEAYRRAVGDAAAQFAEDYREESRAAHARTLTTCEQLREDAATAGQARKRADQRVKVLAERVAALEHLRDDLIGATGLGDVPGDQAIAYIASLRDEVADLRRKDAEHLCEPLPQRTRKIPGIDTAGTEARVLAAKERLEASGPVWQKPPAVPSAAPAAAPDGPRKPAKPRTARSAGKETQKPAQSRTEPQTGGAA